MEPLFFKAENIAEAPEGQKKKDKLQWSRFFSKRKMFSGVVMPKSRSRASMEPLFFKAENSQGLAHK